MRTAHASAIASIQRRTLASLWCFSIHMKKYAIGPISFRICSFCIIVVPVCIPSASVLLLLFICDAVFWVIGWLSFRSFFLRSLFLSKSAVCYQISSRHRLHIALSLFPCLLNGEATEVTFTKKFRKKFCGIPRFQSVEGCCKICFWIAQRFLVWLRASLPLQGKRTRRKATCTVHGGNYTRAGLKINRKRRPPLFSPEARSLIGTSRSNEIFLMYISLFFSDFIRFSM